MFSTTRLLAFCAVLLVLTGSTLLADEVTKLPAPVLTDGCGGYGGGWFGWWPWSVYAREYIPYHALYPPVYYSYPVPRTYGYSPFAYPPGTRTPEIVPVEPLVVPNPHVPQTDEKITRPTATRVARAPLRIRNPFVVQAEDDSNVWADELSAVTPVRPQVVFPAKMRQGE